MYLVWLYGPENFGDRGKKKKHLEGRKRSEKIK